MRVLYDYRIFSLQRYGGISRYFYELIKAILQLKEKDIELFLFEGLYVNEYKLNKLKYSNFNYWGYKRPYIKKTGRIVSLLNNIIFYLYRYNNNFKNKKIVYHPTYYDVNIKKPYPENRIIITVYDMILEKFPQYFPYCDKELAKKQRTIKIADDIICISNNTKKDLLQYYDLDEGKIHVVYIGSNLEIKQVTENEYSRYKNKKPFILFVGKRGNYKNFTVLLDSYYYGKFYRDFDLICFGGDNFNEDELQCITNYNLEKNIHLLTGGDEMLIILYKNASCLVYPSRYEGFGIPVLEAMKLRCPVIASNSSSIPEIAGNAALLFNSENRDELINKLNELLGNHRKRKSLIRAGLKQSKKFSWAKTAEQTIDIYRNLFR